MFGLAVLPYEIVANIVAHIRLDDVYHLAQSCRALSFLLHEESICKSIVQTKIPFSNEGQAALATGGNYSRFLRRYAKRRHALRTADPFTVATVGFCDSYLYCKGMLCYTLDDRVRLLDLRNSTQDEIVLSIPDLLPQALLGVRDNHNGTFQVLYCADHIISCLYSSSGPDVTSWLIVVSPRFRSIITVKELESVNKIFVRHNTQYVYYGTHSAIGVDGYRKWVIHGFDIKRRQWFDQKIHLPDLVGSEIGSTICFEFHGEYFYALSNQTSFEVEEIDWTSFYHCIRFPLASPCNELLEKTENGTDMWRRQHQEGPIDDRWTSLRLGIDEQTNELQILESRKEWHLGASRSQRTYYTTPVKYRKPAREEEGEEHDSVSSSSSDTHDFYSSFFSNNSSSSQGTSASSSFSSTTKSTSSTTTGTDTGTPKTADLTRHDLASFPDGPLKHLLQSTDNPLYIYPPPRKPQFTHPANDSSPSSQPTFTLAKSRLRTYHSSCSTFMDLVDDPLKDDWQGLQRLRLRVGGRSLGPPLHDEEGLLRPPSDNLEVALTEMYREEEIRFWPKDGEGDEVWKLMNPPSCLGNAEGMGDEMGLVYVPGGVGGGPKAIVYVGFDPGVKLAGLRSWEKGKSSGLGEREERSGFIVDGKGKGKTTSGVGTTVGGMEKAHTTGKANVEGGAGARSWAWKEKAMYQDIGLGFYFGR